MSSVVIFAPSPVLTVTIEDHPDGPEVHLHAGGQGVWQARMLLRMGVQVTMCGVLTGESGRALRHLLNDEGVRVVAVERSGRGGAFVHDRRNGERAKIAETGGEPLSRHNLDELYGLMIGESLDADLVILSGPASENALPSDVYRRLASDLATAGKKVIVDLAGERLEAAISGGVHLVKVSHEELLADGRIAADSPEQIVAAMKEIARRGVANAIVTRGDKPLLLLSEGIVSEITVPTMEIADPSGAGDSLTAGVAAALARGDNIVDAVVLGAAAGALNVTRHGLGTGAPETIEKLRQLITVRTVTDHAPTAE